MLPATQWSCAKCIACQPAVLPALNVLCSFACTLTTSAVPAPQPAQAFLKPFSPGVWIALLVTTSFVPLLLFVLENVLQTGQLPVGMSLLTEWRHATYTMFLCCFNLNVLEVLSAPSQLIIVTFAFTNLILVASVGVCKHVAKLRSRGHIAAFPPSTTLT